MYWVCTQCHSYVSKVRNLTHNWAAITGLVQQDNVTVSQPLQHLNHYVMWLSQSCCVTSQSCYATSQGCRVMTQDCSKPYNVIAPRLAVGAVTLSHRARACCTAPSPAPVFDVISQLCKILHCISIVDK